MSNMRVLFSGFRNHLHSKEGGYDRIANMTGSDRLFADEMLLWKKWDSAVSKRLTLLLLDIITRIKRRKYDFTHLFYGEFSMFYFIPYVRSARHKLVITIHMDLEKRRFKKLFLKSLKAFDGVIVLSRAQQKSLKEKYGINSVFIPHGFNHPQYQDVLPVSLKGEAFDKNKINVIVIGQNYRDFKLLYDVISTIKRKDILFHLVGIPLDEKVKYERFKDVTRIYKYLDSNEYYSLIEHSDYNFLPLTYATANNTLLEAQFLNVCSILPDIDGVSDYASPENIFYSDKDECFRIFSNLKKRDRTVGVIKEFAEKFKWENIYKLLREYYNTL